MDGETNEVSEAAEFGTQCHELGAALIAKSLRITNYDEEFKTIEEVKEGLSLYSQEMQEIADGYADFVVKEYEFERLKTQNQQLKYDLEKMKTAQQLNSDNNVIIKKLKKENEQLKTKIKQDERLKTQMNEMEDEMKKVNEEK